MGVGDFSNLQFDDGFGYVNWPQDSVNVPTVMYNYQSIHIADGHWQAYGYN